MQFHENKHFQVGRYRIRRKWFFKFLVGMQSYVQHWKADHTPGISPVSRGAISLLAFEKWFPTLILSLQYFLSNKQTNKFQNTNVLYTMIICYNTHIMVPGNVSGGWTWSDPEMWIDETATIFDSEWHVEVHWLWLCMPRQYCSFLTLHSK